MKNIRMRFVLHTLLLVLIKQVSLSQLSGTYSIPGDYATIAAAVTDLNSQDVGSGGVTFNVAADYTESITSTILLSANGTLSNQIVFQKSGAGANPFVTRTDAGSLSTSTLGGQGDAVFTFHGSDFVTFDGINVSTSNQGIEYGFLFWKVNGTNGCKNITIKNSTVTMTKGTSAFVTGIYISNLVSFSPVSSANGVTVSASGGRHENVSILKDTIQNVFTGILAIGYNNFGINSQDLFDLNCVIGSNGNGNVIQNFGGNTASLSYGIYAKNQHSLSAAHNTINNTAGSGTAFTNGGNGLYIESGYNENVQNNSVTLACTSGKLRGIECQPNRGDGVTSNNTIVLSQNSSFEVAHIYYGQQVVPNSITINNNTLSYGSSINVTQSSYMIYMNTTCPTVTCSGNQSSGTSTVQLTSVSALYYMLYRTASTIVSGTLTITNNTFSNFNFTVPSAGSSVFLIYGIVGGGYAAAACSTNTISNVTITAGRHCSFEGVEMFSGNNSQIYNNSVNSISSTSGTGSVSVKGIVLYEYILASAFTHNNMIYNITTQGFSTGISNASGTNGTAYIYNNQIYNIASTHTSSAVTGIFLSADAVVYNNFISDLRASSSSNNNAVRGIETSSTGSKSLLNNTIFLNASSSTSGFGSSGIISSTSSTLDLKNNIIVNTSTPVGIGITAALRFSSTSLTNYSLNSDYNCFYAGTPGASNLIFYDGTNADQTIADSRARVNARDRHSVSELPTFVNVSVAPYDLHINPATATRLESGGISISTTLNLTDDFDGDARNSSIPDIGADEFTGTFIDETGPTITYTALSSQVLSSTLNISATIVDRTGVDGNPGTKPRAYFRKNINSNAFNDNTNATDGWKYVEASNSSSPFAFSIDYSLLLGGSGVVVGDSIQYFFAAQDLSVTPYVDIKLPKPATAPSSVDLTSSQFPLTGFVHAYGLFSNLSGTITVGSGGNYPSLTTAAGLFAAINSGLLTSNLTVQIISDVTEDGTNALNQWNELPINSNYTITIQPSDATMKTVSGSFAGGLIRLNGADRVTFDGRFGGTGKYLRLTNSATSGTDATIQFISLGTNAGATNNTIRNCEISTGSNSISSLAIAIGGNAITSAGNDNDNISITENAIYKSIYGIYADAGSSAKMNNLLISKNTFGSAVESDYIVLIGLSVSNADSTAITDNDIFNIITNLSGPTGIQLGSGVVNTVISGNKIYSLEYTGSSSFGSCGLDISTGVASSNITIVNNVMYDIIGKGAAAMTSTNIGIRISEVSGATGGFKIYYNSINLFGNSDNASVTQSAAMCFASSLTTEIDLRNNVFENSIVNNLNGSSGAYAIYSLASAASFTSIDYNNYFASGSQGSLGAFIGAGLVTSLAQWQTATGKDANSLNVDPMYVSDSNLVPQTGSTLVSAGTTLIGFSSDILGVVRSASTPTIGAYENESALPVELTSLNASPKHNSVELIWSTATEVNNYGFEIEKSRIQNTEVSSKNKAETYVKVGFVEGNGTTNAPKEYSFSDKNLSTGKYSYRLKQIDRDGKFSYSQSVEVEIGSLPKEFALMQNYPNPFNPSTVISYQLPVNSMVSLKIYDLLGREIVTLVNEEQSAGWKEVKWNAATNASGIYFYKLTAGDYAGLKKLMLLK